MKTIHNPTSEKLAQAIAIPEKQQRAACIVGHRYALTPYDTFFTNGCIATENYILPRVNMYGKTIVERAGLIPIAENEIPCHFDNIETMIFHND